jgi:crossover junction endodeoxyribonuclease RuvC
MRILGLDLSTVASGWAIFEVGDATMSNPTLYKYGVIEPDEDLVEIERYFYIAHQVEGLVRIYRPDELVIEDTFYSKDPTVLKKLNRLAGHIQAIWYKARHKSNHFYMAMSARRSVGLKGNASKEEIVEGVNTFFKLRGRVKDHNIADAIVVAYHHVVASKPEFAVSADVCAKPVGSIDDIAKEIPKSKPRRKLKPDA